MFKKMKCFVSVLLLLIIPLLVFALSSKAEVTGSFEGVNFWVSETAEGRQVFSGVRGKGLLKNEQQEIVAKGDLINVEGFLSIKGKKGATFIHIAGVEPLKKGTYSKETPKDFAVVELINGNRWLLKDSNFVFLLELLSLGGPLKIAIDKSLARASVITLSKGIFRLWGYTVTVGDGGGKVKFRHGKIIDSSNAKIE